MSIKDFRNHITTVNKHQKEYKEYLTILRDEEDMEWYQASKAVMEYLHPNDKLTVKDYQDINKLKSWYTKDQEA